MQRKKYRGMSLQLIPFFEVIIDPLNVNEIIIFCALLSLHARVSFLFPLKLLFPFLCFQIEQQQEGWT